MSDRKPTLLDLVSAYWEGWCKCRICSHAVVYVGMTALGCDDLECSNCGSMTMDLFGDGSVKPDQWEMA